LSGKWVLGRGNNMSEQDLQEQLAELQARVAFQDDTIEVLDEALSRQQQDILVLQRAVHMMRDEMKKAQEQRSEFHADERPPHY
jgi:SlyX protein